MGIKLQRQKPRMLIKSVFYRLVKLPLSDETKLKLFLNLEWIFDRLAHEMSFKVYRRSEHPARVLNEKFLFEFIKSNHTVLDLGCSFGDLSWTIAQRAKTVVGIDYNRHKIEFAQKNYKQDNLIFILDDAREYLKKMKIK
jgi:2-polyprenyl-3-methyl-5-hydroxy-6-metoxy-1,4-benzoquinol methylase